MSEPADCTGAQLVLDILADEGIEVGFRLPGRRDHADLRRSLRASYPPRSDAARGRRRLRRRRIRPGDRPGRRLHGDLRSGRDQSRDRHPRRANGFGSDRCDYGAGPDHAHGHGRLSRSRRDVDHGARYETQRLRPGHSRSRTGSAGGLPGRARPAARPRSRRYSERYPESTLRQDRSLRTALGTGHERTAEPG